LSWHYHSAAVVDVDVGAVDVVVVVVDAADAVVGTS